MRIAIMQPYFMPYIGYFSLIKNSDEFILFDTVQTITHGWIERNRVLKNPDGWQYIRVPLEKHSRDTKIKSLRIKQTINWKEKIIAQLVHYKKAPYYYKVIQLINEIFQEDYDSIVKLNHNSMKKICEYLEIKTPIKIFSEMDLEIEPAKSADEWALNICKAIPGVTEYWNPIGGTTFFDRRKYEEANINIKFLEMKLIPYSQHRSTFEEGLSIIDVMMFNSIDEIRAMMDNYSLV